MDNMPPIIILILFEEQFSLTSIKGMELCLRIIIVLLKLSNPCLKLKLYYFNHSTHTSLFYVSTSDDSKVVKG